MTGKSLVPGHIPDIRAYLRRKENDYRTQRRLWLSGPPDLPPDYCILTRMPTELMLLIIEDLYQADLFHLGVTCRKMAECTRPTMYTRDITRFGCMALRWACTFGVVSTLERTVQHGAPINYIFPADSAIGCEWILEGLGKSTTRPSRSYRYVSTSPLVTAIVAHELVAVEALCALGADVNAIHDTVLNDGSQIRMPPIHLAMGNPNCPVQLQGIQPDNPKIMQLLLDAGADPNQDSESLGSSHLHATPLFLTIQSKYPAETVKLLLEKGANPTKRAGLNRSDSESSWRGRSKPPPCWLGRLPLQVLLAAYSSDRSWRMNLDKAELLVAHGGADDAAQMMDPGTLEIIPRYPLLYHNLDHPQIIRLTRMILARGPDLIGYTARCGISPIQAIIWWAEARSGIAYTRREEVSGVDLSRLLNTMMAFPAILDRASELITMMAETSLICRNPSADGGWVLGRSSIIDSRMWIAKWCTRRRGERQMAYSYPTPLSYLCAPFAFPGSTRLIPILLSYGARINASCSAGVTPLHHSVMFNDGGTALRSLVNFKGGPARSGLKVNAQDNKGWTPLHYACHFGFRQKREDQVEAVQILLVNGAEIHAKTNNGVTPLLLTFWSCNPTLIKMLLDRGASREDLEVLSGQADPVSSDILLVNHQAILFEHTDPSWRVFGPAEWEVGQDVLEIITLLSPLLDGRLVAVNSSNATCPYAEEYDIRTRTQRHVEMCDTSNHSIKSSQR